MQFGSHGRGVDAEVDSDSGKGISSLVAVSRFNEVNSTQLPTVRTPRYASVVQMLRDGAVVNAELSGELEERSPTLVLDGEISYLGDAQSALHGRLAGV